MTISRLFRRGQIDAAGALDIDPSPVDLDSADPFTVVGDRFSLKESLDTLLARTAGGAGDERPVLLLIDLDDFSAVNDREGRDVGDRALREYARRLSAGAPAGSAVFRVMGDQFAVLLENATSDEAVTVARALFEVIRQPYAPRGDPLEMRSSTAIVVLEGDQRADAVLHAADVAMYAAKAAGGSHVYVYSRQLDDWATARKRQIDQLLADVEHLRQQNRTLSESLLVDVATGLPNAAVFEADLAQLDARRRRSGDPFAVMIADIDWFFDYAQRCGPQAAERSLALLAQTLAGAIRPGDRAYRYGLDEFAVLMPGATSHEAVTAAEQIRLEVQSRSIAHPPNPSGVLTVTVGVAEGGFRHASTKDLLSEVTDLVRAGKDQGRNRIVWPH